MDERLSSYALIARAAIDVTVPLLTGHFSERFVRLHQVIIFSFYVSLVLIFCMFIVELFAF